MCKEAYSVSTEVFEEVEGNLELCSCLLSAPGCHSLDTFHKENLLIFLAPLPSGFLLHLNSLCFLIVHLNNGDDGGNNHGDDHNGDNNDCECGEKILINTKFPNSNVCFGAYWNTPKSNMIYKKA